MTRRHLTFVLFAFVLFCVSGNVFAITDEEVFRNFQFSFVNPGARSTAMGGAFIGLADDATAAEANPAGLTILTKPEVSFEYRGTWYDPDKLNSINGLNIEGVNFAVSSRNNLDNLNQPSFLSVIFPAGSSTYGFSRQESVRQKGNIDERFDLTFQTDQGPLSVTLLSLADVDQKVVNWNFSYAAKISKSWSVGATLRYSQLNWQNEVRNGVFLLGTAVPQYTTTIDDTDNAFAFDIGTLGKLGEHASWGLVYKRNPKFEVTETSTGTGAFAPPEGPINNVLKIPDTFGGGIAIKPSDSITLNADFVYVKYSDLTDSLVPRYNIITVPARPGSLSYKVDNKTEFHIGVEYVVMLKNTPLALREGYYRKPANSLLVSGSDTVDRQLLDTIFGKRDDENHFTLGSGFVFGQHFQIDWAADIAKSVSSFVLSTVVRF
jgi:long-subunit fatty acid transport protein